jgi:hypothetical protein
MRAACLGACALALACGNGGAGSLPTLKHPSVTPGARLRLVGFWGRAICSTATTPTWIVGRVDASGKPAWSVDGGVMTRLAVARDGSFAFAGDREGALMVVDLRTGKRRWGHSMAPPSGSAIIAVALSPDAHLAASAGAAGDLSLRNADTGALLDTAQLKVAATALAFAPDGRSLYAGDAAGVVFRFAL